MSSILKVNTIRPESGTSITIGADGEAVVNNSPSLTRQGTSANPITFTVTVAAKTSANVYNGVGSSNAYFIDGQEAPSILIEGNESSSYEYYYKFDQSDASNSGHPLRFYFDANKTTQFTIEVTTSGTPGSAGAYTQIKVGGSTPNVVYYQCSSHAFMGNKLINPATRTFNSGGVGIKLPTGSPNTDQIFKVSGVSNGIAELTYGSAVTFPTISSISPSVIQNSQTSITITGTNFVNGINVEAVSTTGAIVQADTVTFSSSTSFSANFTITTDGTYFIRVENPDGNAARSSTALLTVSDAPTFSTAAGSLGSMAAGDTANFTVTATSDSAVTYAVTSGALPGGTSLNTSTGAITGTESGTTAETTYNFTITATDAEAQTASRAFSITVTLGINNGGQFN